LCAFAFERGASETDKEEDMPLLIDNEVAGEILSMKDCVEALESAFREEGDGSAANRTKSNIHIPTKQEEKWYLKPACTSRP
jgi:hypothetical protein